MPSRAIAETNLGVREIWRVSSWFVISDGHQFAYMFLVPSRIVAENSTRSEGTRLVSVDTSTGSVEWEVKYRERVSSIIADQSKLYVASAGYPLRAYELETGKLVWSGPDLPARRLYFLNLQNNTLLNYSGSVQFLDPETGKLLREDSIEKTPSDSYFIMWLDEFTLRKSSHQTSNELLKIRRETGEIVWRTPLDVTSGLARKFPILSDNRLIALFGRIDMDLYVIDFTTGQRLWKANDTFVSNAAVSQGKVYALRQDARLMVFDEMTGAELGYVQFTPAETDPAGRTYWVGVDEQGRVFVSFSDSKELIALATEPE